MWPFTLYPELSPSQTGASVPFDEGSVAEHTYDFIIIGGGTAGAVLTSRLSEDPSFSVLLIERGPAADGWSSNVPLISCNILSKEAAIARWPSAPLDALDGRILDIVRGQGLGGGSRVNGMLYSRGYPNDYNRFKEMGHPTWDYEHMLPYFVKSEKTLTHPRSNYRGHDGVFVNQTFPQTPYAVLPKLRKALYKLGVPHIQDLNSPHAPSVGLATVDVAIDPNMRRVSTFSAFLPREVAIARKKHLKICTNAVVSRVDLSSSLTEGKPRAQGVYFASLDGKAGDREYYARARREVIVCAGALGSPQVLMLSGIGPSSHLEHHRISVVSDLSGVGSHLQDHIGVPVIFRIPIQDSLHQYLNSLWLLVKQLVSYILWGTGVFARTFLQFTIFLRTSLIDENDGIIPLTFEDLDCHDTANIPDLEIMPSVVHNSDDPGYPIEFGVISLMSCVLKPKSFGTVRLASRDARVHPSVNLGYLTDTRDYELLRKGIRVSMHAAGKVKEGGYSIEPLEVPNGKSDAELDVFIRRIARTTYHYASSCRIGKREEGGVVNDVLKVHGVEGLRVCDTSIFPEIPATHLMAPVIAVAERCADFIREEHGGSR